MTPQPTVFNIWDQAANTLLVQNAVELILGNGRERIASQFAPIEPTQVDKISLEKFRIKAVGKGRIIADDATPPIYRPKTKIIQEEFELLRLAEMTPIEESLRRQLQLNGTDFESQQRRNRAGADIVTRARALQVRNENMSDWLVMQSIITGECPIEIANPPGTDEDTEYVLDFEFPASHLPVVSTTFSDLTNALPIDYLRAWQERLRAATGSWGIHFWMSSEVMDYILRSKQVRDSMTPNVGPQYIATEEHVKALLHEPDRVEFHVTDAGWFEESSGYDPYPDDAKTRWIPKDRIITTTENPHNGQPIAQMYDGMVPVQISWNDYEYRGPGAQSYVQLLQGNLTLQWRQESRRVPIVHQPECIISAKVVL